MNKKLMSIISVIIAIGVFLLGIEGLTRYRLDVIKVPVVKELKTDRSQILTDDIIWQAFPRKYVHEDTVVDKEAIENTYVRLNHTIYPGMPILSHEVESLDLSHDDAILRLHQDQSVFALKTDLKESFGGMLNVGHRVDISFVSRTYKEQTAFTILKQVRVIGAKDSKGIDVSNGSIPAVVLLAIDHDAIEMLLEAESMGHLTMTLVEKDPKQECIIVKELEFE